MTISKEQYGLWKHEPVTRFYFQFLRDKTEFLTKTATNQWLDGNPWSDTTRGQIIELIEILALEFEFIQSFYQETHGTEPESHQE